MLRQIWRSRTLYLFLLPSLILVAIWAYTPIVSSILLAFTRWVNPTISDPRGHRIFVGLEHFRRLLKDEVFWSSLLNWLKVLGVHLFTSLVPPLLVANIVFHLRTERSRYAFRTVFVSQLVIPTVVVFLLWHFFYSSTGPIDRILVSLGFDRFKNFSWLTTPSVALWAVLFVGFPWVAPLQFLVYFAGLQSISESVYDATAIDGATWRQRFFLVEIPMIFSQIRLMVILAIISSTTMFANILMMYTSELGMAARAMNVYRNPAIVTPALYLYGNGFVFQKLEYACANGVVLIFIALGLSQLVRKTLRIKGAE